MKFLLVDHRKTYCFHFINIHISLYRSILSAYLTLFTFTLLLLLCFSIIKCSYKVISLNFIFFLFPGFPNNGEDEWKSIPEKRRMFSMWSRLQSLNPKGHELHHRRHMHAYYIQSAADSNSGIVNAVVPRTPSRPPGSPLRWG